jgi:hypothetical protein
MLITTVFSPIHIYIFMVSVCPDFVPEQDRCEDIDMSVGIFVEDGVDEEQVLADISGGISRAIENKQLQVALDEVNPNSRIRIVTGSDASDYSRDRAPGQTPFNPDDDGLSTGGIIGIAVGSLVGILVIPLLIRSRRSDESVISKIGEDGADDLMLQEIESPDPNVPDGKQGGNRADELMLQENEPSGANAVANRTASTDTTTLALESTPGTETDKDNITYLPSTSPTKEGDGDADSQVSSSGWSSHAGRSSLDTASIDVDDELAAFSLNSTTNDDAAVVDIDSENKQLGQHDEDNEIDIEVAISDMDDAISQGNWRAVGVTANLLLSSGQSIDTKSLRSKQSFDTRSFESADSSFEQRRKKSTIDAARAAEIDELVEAGDWEGVVALGTCAMVKSTKETSAVGT